MIEWKNAQPATRKAYVCGHCGTKVAPDQGLSGVAVAYHNFQRLEFGAWMLLCVQCGMPTVFVMQDDPTEEPYQTPAPAYGDAIPNLPEKVKAIYNEARESMKVSAFTGVAMLCRALVAHLAVEKGGADEQELPVLRPVARRAARGETLPSSRGRSVGRSHPRSRQRRKPRSGHHQGARDEGVGRLLQSVAPHRARLPGEDGEEVVEGAWQ